MSLLSFEEFTLQGKEIRERLKGLIQAAADIEPGLAKRLEEIDRWIKDLKPGELTAKRFVRVFLLQILVDGVTWLDIKAKTSEEQQTALQQMLPTRRYWYGELFPRWIEENDPKFYIWRQKLMAGEFNQADEKVIHSVAQAVSQQGGEFWHCYIADLSMATDLIVSHLQQQPLCTQLTSLSSEYSEQKYKKWKITLQSWRIDRGLFLSYNPGISGYTQRSANLALYNSDTLPSGTYQQNS